MSWSGVQEALQRGDAHGALRAALAVAVHETPPHVAAKRRCEAILSGLRRWPQLPGSLAGDRELHGALTRAWAARRNSPPLPPEVLLLFSPAAPEPGAALFPVVLGDTGLMRRLVVRPRNGHHPPRHPVVDPAFLEALALATKVVAAALDQPVAAQEAGVSWWVEPDLPSNADLAGGSVGLAAVVALTSFQLRVAPPSVDVYTGCLRAEGRGARLVAVDAGTLHAKARAAARVQAGATGVRFFHPAGNHEPDTRSLEARPVRRGWAEWLDDAELFSGEVQRARHRVEARATGISGDARCVLFLLLAAGEPLSAALLGEATPAMRAEVQEGGATGLPRTGEDTAALRARDLAEPVEQGWVASEVACARHPGQDDPLWYRAAHRALGRATGWPLADTPSRRALHLLAAGEPVEAAAVLAACDERAAARALWFLRDSGVDPNRCSALVAALPEGAHADLLRIVHAASGLPPWLARLGRTLADHEDWTDRLFTVQALVQAALHVLAVVALAEGQVDEQTRTELARRPSVGLLGRAAAALCAVPAPPSAAGRLLAQEVAAVARANTFDELAKRLNAALHEKLALVRLSGGDEDGSRVHLRHLAPHAERLLGALARAAHAGWDLRDLDADSARFAAVVDGDPEALDLGDQLRRLDSAAAPMFHRGRLGLRERWWSYEDCSTAWAPDAPLPPAVGPHLDLGALPTPLAIALVHVQRGAPGLDQLAAVDLLLFSLLRLVAGPGLARALKEAGGALAKPLDLRLSRMNHRNLLDLALAAGDPPFLWLHQGSARELVEWLLDKVERHQHAPGPRQRWAAAAGDLAPRARALLALGPWTEAVLVLQDAPEQTLRGPQPRCLSAPSSEERPLAWRIGDQILPLDPIARVPAQARKVHLLVQVDRPRKMRRFTDAEPCWCALDPRRLQA